MQNLKYMTLYKVVSLHIQILSYHFFPVITRALGTVLKDLHEKIKQLGFNKKDSNDIINATQQRVALSTVKICKTF